MDTSQAFTDWLSTAQARCALPLTMNRRKTGGLDILIHTPRSTLTAVLTDRELMVPLDQEELCWDLLLSLEAAPIEDPEGGMTCTLCPAEDRPVFPSLDALWRDHLFEPFLDWINTKAAPATGLGLYRTAKGSTWASFGQEDELRASGADVVLVL